MLPSPVPLFLRYDTNVSRIERFWRARARMKEAFPPLFWQCFRLGNFQFRDRITADRGSERMEDRSSSVERFVGIRRPTQVVLVSCRNHSIDRGFSDLADKKFETEWIQIMANHLIIQAIYLYSPQVHWICLHLAPLESSERPRDDVRSCAQVCTIPFSSFLPPSVPPACDSSINV